MTKLSDPVTAVRGIGTSRAALLERLHITTVYDLLTHYPREYTDTRQLSVVSGLKADTTASVRVRILSAPRVFRKKGYTIVQTEAEDETGMITAVWFNQPYMAKSIHKDRWYILRGRVKSQYGRMSINAPVLREIDPDSVYHGGMEPQYALTEGLSMKSLRAMIHEALDETEGQWEDVLTQEQKETFGFPDRGYAIRHVHEPESPEDAERARNRLVFDELLIMQSALRMIRLRTNTQKEGFALPYSHEERLLEMLPYTLTEDQQQVWETIREELKTSRPMHRLVQGDVGSGKTVIAMLALLQAADNGMQGALMAPTEVLARQHAKTLRKYFGPLGVSVGYLGGSLPQEQKREVQRQLQTGELQVVTGTHALFQEGVHFQKLGVVVTDEQHRFGVGQRMALADKSAAPNVLVMTATPIPRTLALVLYGDMDLSTIRTMPSGRRPVRTFCVNASYDQRLYAFMRKQTEAGHQVYIICPLVEEQEQDTGNIRLTPAVSYHAYLSEEIFPDLSVGLLHGRMKSDEKDAVMEAYVRGDIQILVSTTVVEVGVDVPNATLMVIENAERFGLAQLHQLRGRVGRGDTESFCILKSDVRSPEVRERLSILCRSNDGFYIAEQDLKTRGSGDLFGLRQSGLPEFRIADLYRDTKILEQTQQLVEEIYTLDPALQSPEYAGLRRETEAYIKKSEAIHIL